MRDFTYTARMILWLEDETTLADANYDGDVNVLDMTQIGLIILGRESKLTLVDSADRIVTVNKPVERIVSGHVVDSEAVKLLGAWDRVVGRDPSADEILFPGVSDLPVCVGLMNHYDVYYETVFELDPDIFLTFYMPIPGLDDIVDTLEPDIPVVCLNFENPATLVENIKKLRYVLNTEERGEAYIEFYEGVVNDITEKTAGLSEVDKPQVFLWPFNFDYQDEYMVYGEYAPGIQAQMEIVGGIDIGKDVEGACPHVGSEWLAGQDIDVIVGHVSPWVVPGIFAYDVTDPTVAQDTIDWVMDADENPALAESDAVTNERVYLHQQELMGSPRFVVGLAYMAKWFHPDLFGDDFDPHEIHMTCLTDHMDVERSEVEDSILFWPEP
jgi:iron complex transport system substrate-binding protein